MSERRWVSLEGEDILLAPRRGIVQRSGCEVIGRYNDDDGVITLRDGRRFERIDGEPFITQMRRAVAALGRDYEVVPG